MSKIRKKPQMRKKYHEEVLIEKGFQHDINIIPVTKYFETLEIDTDLSLKDCLNNAEEKNLTKVIIKSVFIKSFSKESRISL